LSAVLDEVRRVYAYVPGMFGIAKKDFEFQGHFVPKGYPIVGMFYSTTHDYSEWSEPFKFKPERYSKGEPSSGKDWAWVPQGARPGNHMCAGFDIVNYALKAIIIRMVRQGCTWFLPAQNFEQNLHLFNPEPYDGVKTHSFRCNMGTGSTWGNVDHNLRKNVNVALENAKNVITDKFGDVKDVLKQGIDTVDAKLGLHGAKDHDKGIKLGYRRKLMKLREM
jgi:hypothetical protein